MTVAGRPVCYEFAGFKLQPEERRLLTAGEPAALGPRAFDLLVALVGRAGELVTKDELLDRVWPKLVVEENNLAVQISTLRKVLGSAAIETIPGHGYRFTLRVSAVEARPELPQTTRRQNLPHQPTTFVGREAELAETKRLLEGTQLLTLLGIGGIGKTRLSLELAAEVLADYPDGVWLVELAPLADPRLVPQAVASVLGVAEEPGRPLLESLTRHLRDRKLLLVLDDCEHLLQACAELVKQMLQAASGVRILTSSREPLRVPGETTYPVAALATPDPRQPIAVDALTRYAAVQLFLDRAIAAQPAFQVTPQNTQAVSRICHDLDGIPLALELAAARVRAMPVETIADRRSDRFRLLKGGDKTALPRQQTLRAMMDWSYDLLVPDERALLARLAVFAGGFTVAGAEAVGAGDGIADVDVLDLLGNLVEKSLVAMDAPSGRYRLLETVRQYALERLVEAGAEDQARLKHLRFYLALAQDAEAELLGPRQSSWHGRLDVELENILSAHAWCDRAPGGGETGLQLIHSLRPWLCRNHLELWHRVCVEVLMREDAQQRNLARCQGLYAASSVSYYMGRYDESRSWAEESLSIAQQIAHALKTLDAHIMLGSVCLGQDDRAAAGAHLKEGLALAQMQGDKMRLAAASGALAELAAAEGAVDVAEPLYEDALKLNRELGNHEGVAILLFNVARISITRGHGARAAKALCEALTIAGGIGSAQQGQQLLTVCAGLAASRADWPRAARFYGAAEAQLEQQGFRREPADEVFLAPLVATTRQALGPNEFDAAAFAARTLSFEAMLAEARAWLQDIAQN